MSKAVVIVSGGLDSSTLLKYLLSDEVGLPYEPQDLLAVSFFYGQRHDRELECARSQCLELGVPWILANIAPAGAIAKSVLTDQCSCMPTGRYDDENMKQTVVPNRNMIMLAHAIAKAIDSGAKAVFYGAHQGDHAIYPDCRPGFVHAMDKAAGLCHFEPIRIFAPFIDINKTDILRMGLRLGVDYSKTWSCYNGREKACGKCGSCNERLEAFEQCGAKDPIAYED